MAEIERILGAGVGEIVTLSADACMLNDGEGHRAVDIFAESGKPLGAKHVVVVLDHDVPAGSFDSAAIHKKLIGFARHADLECLYAQGIGYQLLAGRLDGPGRVVFSTGSHHGFFGARGNLGLGLGPEAMAAYLAEGSIRFTVPPTLRVEFAGQPGEGAGAADIAYSLLAGFGRDAFAGLSVDFAGAAAALDDDARITLCATATQAGAAAAFVTAEPAGPRDRTAGFDVGTVRPAVVPPGDLFAARGAESVAGIRFHAGFIGGCNGGRIESLRQAAGILKGRRVKVGFRLMVGFASNEVYLRALDEGLVETFLDSGVQVTNPGCGSCLTTSIGVAGDGENMITTGSHNFAGCAGSRDSKVYIASARTVARAALAGFVKTEGPDA